MLRHNYLIFACLNLLFFAGLGLRALAYWKGERY